MIWARDAFSPVRDWPPAASWSEAVRPPVAAVTRKTKATIASFLIEEWLRSGVGVGVREGSGKTVGQSLHESHDLVFLRICQTELADGHVLGAGHLRHRPAVDLLGRSGRTVADRHGEREHITRVVEVDDLLQALQVAVVHIR